MHCDKKEIIKKFGYSPDNERSILSRARLLRGHTISQVIDRSPLEDKPKELKGKGAIGNVVERHWFGIKNNSSPDPDFIDAGIELKIIPLERSAKGLTVKERTKICSINYFKLIEEKWGTSHAKRKLNKILFIYYHYNKEQHDRSVVKYCDLWRLRGGDAIVIGQDWDKVKQKVSKGEAHLLSESIGKVLAAARSGQGGRDEHGRLRDLVGQPRSSKKALKRAFALKQSFTGQRWLQVHKNIKFESLIDSLKIKASHDLEETLLKKLHGFTGMTLGVFAQRFNIDIPKGKNAAATIVKKAIGFKNVNSRIKEFEQTGVEIRIVPVRSFDKRPWEAVSFPSFRLSEFIGEKWDNSLLKDYVDRILFIPIYRDEQRTPLSERTIEQAFFWTPSKEEEEMIKKEWKRYQDEVWQGKCKVIKEKRGDVIREVTGLSKESQTMMIHIRPHGKDRTDRDVNRLGNSVVKQSFWLNKAFVHKLIKKHAN